MKTENQHTLSEKTTAMEKAIRMAKEVHEAPERAVGAAINWNAPVDERYQEPTPKSTQILETAKQIYDWLTA